MNSSSFFPLIVSNSYISSAWDLPYHPLIAGEFVLTWVKFGKSGSMTYLTSQEKKQMDLMNKIWQQQTFENLRHSMAKEEGLFTHFKKDNQGKLIFLAFLHKDGIGSSRILFSEELKQLFPNGYRIAFPDRSCGLAINADLSPKEAEEIRDLVEGIHNNATTPMSSKLYNPDDLNIKQEWILPIDAAFSQQLIE